MSEKDNILYLCVCMALSDHRVEITARKQQKPLKPLKN